MCANCDRVVAETYKLESELSPANDDAGECANCGAPCDPAFDDCPTCYSQRMQEIQDDEDERANLYAWFT